MPDLWARFERWPPAAQVASGAAAAFLAMAVVIAALSGSDDGTEVVAGAEPVAEAPSATGAEMGTTPDTEPEADAGPGAMPPGQDTVVSAIVDGDTLDVALGAGTRIRLIGVDTPERGDCYFTEAADHLRRLVPVGTPVRLAYDVGRRDSFGRTLAYLYRLDDGLFVNLAMAEDGYALQLTVPPNVAHADEFGAAVARARDSDRGRWGSCEPASPAAGDSTPSGPAPAGACDPAYPGVCIPPAPPDLDCGDIAHRRFEVQPPDPHRFDGDSDGIACEG